MTGRGRKLEVFVGLLADGFEVSEVTSTADHLSITMRCGGQHEELTLDGRDVTDLLASELLELPGAQRPSPDEADRIATFSGMLREGFTVTGVESRGDQLSILLRMGPHSETLTFEGDVARRLALGLLDAPPT